jgi:hypothetical protein
MPWIDDTLYPDTPAPARIQSTADRIDFIPRLCAAWDFGVLPDSETVPEVSRPAWREAVDLCQLLTSPTYHLLRRWHSLPPRPFLGSIDARIRNDEFLTRV